MLYRENGQFKTTYARDQQVFPILQDRIGIALLLLVAFVAVPLLAPEYLFRAILIPFLILALAALGLNILVGYCGQISLGTGAFMAVGAYAAYNFQVRIEGLPLVLALLGGGLCATIVGVLFGIPSLRIKGLYLAVATLAAQFFVDWAFLRVSWFTNDSASGSVSVSGLQVFGMPITLAATSMSRIAIHSRPIAPRTRFLARTAKITTTARQKRYFCSGVSIGIPNTCKPDTLTEPDAESLVNHWMRRNAQSTKNCAASVATAR